MEAQLNNLNNALCLAFSSAIRPMRDLTVSQFAEEYIYNPSNTSDAGKFSLSRAPYQKEIMDSLTPNNGINKVVFMAGAQIGKTFIATVWNCYVFYINPQNFICYQPTIALAEQYTQLKLNPIIDSSPVIKEVFEKNKKSNGISTKTYKGCTARYLGANSGNSFRMISAPYIFADEIDSYPFDVEGEGNPMKLIDSRMSTFGRKRKIFLSSTPTIQDYSAIEKEFKEGDQRYYHVPCPHCDAKQVLKFPNLKFEILNKGKENEKVNPYSIYYECEVCSGHITEDKKTWMLLNGEWVASNPNAPKEIRSYHISSLYSPLGWYSWEQLCNEFLDCRDDPFSLKAFKNTKLGETYYEKAEQPSVHKLKNRAEDYQLNEVNEKAVMLFAGVDTQPNRLCCLVIAIGEDGETWVVNYDEFNGSPTEPMVWEALENSIRRPYKHKSGVDLYIKAVAIDTGGHNTNDVYDFVRKNQDKYFAIKGASHDIGHYIKESSKIDIDPRTGKKLQNSLSLYLVNTHLIKKYIYINLNNMLSNEKKDGARVIHFSKELQENFYEMLVSEKLIRKVVKGQTKEEFIKPKTSTRNEVLDCFVYAYAMAFNFNVQRIYGDSYKKLWDLNIGNKTPEKKEELKIKAQKKVKSNNSWINKNGWSLK